MPSHVVNFERLSRRLRCCGGPCGVWTSPRGTETDPLHGRWCRTGRLLSQPGAMHAPTFEPAPSDDRRQIRSPR